MVAAVGRRHLPRGWSDLGRQLLIWFGFAVLYQVARGFADRNSAKAFWAAWPAWVWFAVMATGNHFWLDCVAGIFVAILAMTAVYNRRLRPAFAARRP